MKKFFSVFVAVLVLISLFSVSALAVNDSPGGKPVFNVDISSFSTGSKADGEVSTDEAADYAWVEIGGEKLLRLRAAKSSSYTFTGWVIDGEYDIVEGSLTSKEIIIRVKSDIEVEESYDVQGSQGFGQSNKDPEAPETGDSVLAFAVFAVLAAAGIVVARKRLAA